MAEHHQVFGQLQQRTNELVRQQNERQPNQRGVFMGEHAPAACNEQDDEATLDDQSEEHDRTAAPFLDPQAERLEFGERLV